MQVATSKKEAKMTRVICREKLIKLIKKSKPGKYKPTLNDVVYWYDNINAHIFEGHLPTPTAFSIKPRPGFWAQTTCDVDKRTRDRKEYVTVDFNDHFPSKKVFIEALAHEMVHIWEFKEYGSMGHGLRFFSWEPKLRRFGLRLTLKL